MKRYQLVDALGWEKSICTVLLESDDCSIALAQQNVLSPAMNQPLGVIDTWTRTDFPRNVKPLFKTEQDVTEWLRKHEAEQRRKAKV